MAAPEGTQTIRRTLRRAGLEFSARWILRPQDAAGTMFPKLSNCRCPPLCEENHICK